MTVDTATAGWSATWVPPAEVAVRGTVVVLPGRGEPASVYTRLGRRLAVDGYRVAAATEVDTADSVRAAIGSEPGPGPLVLIGADTGAATALALSATAIADGIAGVVLAGLPATGGAVADLSWAAELEARTGCPVHRTRLSEDAGVVRGALWPAPVLPWPPGPLAEPQVPVLALHGAVDVIAPLAAVRAALDPLSRVRLVLVGGGRHDVLNDVQHRSVAAEIVQFLERLRLSAEAAAILESTVEQ
jgi:pimeloyl-ACP methyl ester carboxylesterase